MKRAAKNREMWWKVEVEKKKRNIRKKIEGRNGNKKSGDAGGDKCLGQMRSAHWKRIKKKDIEQSKNPVLNSVKRRAATNNNQKKKNNRWKQADPVIEEKENGRPLEKKSNR